MSPSRISLAMRTGSVSSLCDKISIRNAYRICVSVFESPSNFSRMTRTMRRQNSRAGLRSITICSCCWPGSGKKLLLILLCASGYKVDYFHTGVFFSHREPGLYEVDTGLEGEDAMLASFAFVDEDQSCDVVVLSGDRSTLIVYKWSDDFHQFLRFLDLPLAGYINAVATGDFNYDGKLDLLVTRTVASKQLVEIYLRTKDFLEIYKTFENGVGHPAPFDLNGDQGLDLTLNVRSSSGSVTAYVYEKNHLDQTFFLRPLVDYAFRSADHCLTANSIRLSLPHSVSFVDLNGDCQPDLFVTSIDALGDKYFEVWLNMKNGEYCIVQKAKAPIGAGQVSFADIDRNGAEDLVFPVCVEGICNSASEIHVIFNDNNVLPTCKFDNNIISYKRFRSLDISATETNNNTVVWELQGAYFPSGDIDVPVTIHTGDLDLDGFPELLVTLDDGGGVFCGLISNIEGKGTERRSFDLRLMGEYRKLRDRRGATLCTFFDLDENGVLDVMVTVQNKNGVYSTLSFYNNFLPDTFRLKARMLISTGKSSLSSTYSGPVFAFSYRQLDFSTVRVQSTQLPQTSYFSLIPPYCIFGVGRIVSYIEDFHATVPTLAHSVRSWSPVIPNSQLVVSPKRTDVEGWQLRLFVRPAERIGAVMVGIAVVLGTLGVWAIVRLRKERTADKRASIGALLGSR